MSSPSPHSGLLSEPPRERELPDRLRHRQELLAIIAADRPGPRPHRRAVPRLGQWMLPLAAAAAVTAIVVTATALAPASSGHRTGHGSAPARPPATSQTASFPPCAVLTPGQCHRTASYVVTAALRALTVSDPVGAVTITGSSRSSVSVTEHASYSGDPPLTRSTVSDGTLALSYRCHRADCGVSYDIEVPRSLAVQVSTGVGSIRLSWLAGQVRATAATGSISGQSLSSRVADLVTSLGSVDAVFTAVPDRLGATSQTGSITLQVPGDASYAVRAGSSLGSVSVGVPQSASSHHVIVARTNLGSVAVTSD
jgi:hypothetical protein